MIDRRNSEAALRACERARATFSRLPRTIGRYRISGELGHGGMGVVYAAYDPQLDRSLALKVVRIDEPFTTDRSELEARFRTEMRAAGRVAHPNVLSPIDAGTEPALHYTMKWIRGETLRERVQRRGPMSRSEALHCAAGIARGLAEIHRAGIIHRDLKPSNILLTEEGVPMISDFGLCQFLDSETRLTGSCEIVGTPQYLAPEQIRGDRVAETADLFALGAILIFMLTGSDPFDAGDCASQLERVLYDAPDGLDQLDPDIAILIDRLTEKSPHQRLSDAEQIATLLDRLRAPSPIALSVLLPRRKTTAWIASLALVLGLLLGSPLLQHEPMTRVADPDQIFDSSLRESVGARLGLLQTESGIDARVRAIPASSGDLTGFADSEFRRLELGPQGLLIVYDEQNRAVRLEVGYGLEGVFPDSRLGRLVDAHIAPLFAAGDSESALLFLARILQDEIRHATLANTYDPTPTVPFRFQTASGGGGASGIVMAVGDEAPTAPGDALAYLPGDNPEASYRTFLRWLGSGAYAPEAPIFTPESRRFLADWPMTPALLEHLYSREADQSMEFLVRGDRVIVYCTTSPFVSPHLLVRTHEGWQVDIVGEVEEVISFGASDYTWSFQRLRSPRLRDFADEMTVIDGLIRLRKGDNRRLAWTESS